MTRQTSLRYDWCVFGYEVLIQVNLYCSIIAFSPTGARCSQWARSARYCTALFKWNYTQHTSQWVCVFAGGRSVARSLGLCQLKQSAGQRVAHSFICRLQRVIASPIMQRRTTLWSFAQTGETLYVWSGLVVRSCHFCQCGYVIRIQIYLPSMQMLLTFCLSREYIKRIFYKRTE
jgi:hypothetical protein